MGIPEAVLSGRNEEEVPMTPSDVSLSSRRPTDPSTPIAVDRLTELVTHLSGAPGEAAREAVIDAVTRNGEWGDNLLNIADALVAVRGDEPVDTDLDDLDDLLQPTPA